MMYGGTAGTNYFIATNAGVRMTAGGSSSNEIYCSGDYTVMRAEKNGVYSSISISSTAVTTTQN